jgi:hypothetical protein
MAIVGAAEDETRKEKVSYSIPSLCLDALDDSRAGLSHSPQPEAEATRNETVFLALVSCLSRALVSIAPFAPTFSNIGIQIFFSLFFFSKKKADATIVIGVLVYAHTAYNILSTTKI